MVGTRPEWIHLKAYITLKRLNLQRHIIVNTGQHSDFRMAQSFIEELKLPAPTINLGSSPVDLPKVTGMLRGVYSRYKVSQVLVVGDTDSALAGALAAYNCGIEIVHIEAGLRCNERIPEEVNRRCIDTLADILLAPEDYAVRNLKREKVLGAVVRSPNYKVLFFRAIVKTMRDQTTPYTQPYGVLTMHRRENIDSKMRLKKILSFLSSRPDRIVWPIHPRARERMQAFGLKLPGNITICDPWSYFQTANSLLFAESVFTDSGGLMLEAHELKKNLFVLRRKIEWMHLLNSKRTVLPSI